MIPGIEKGDRQFICSAGENWQIVRELREIASPTRKLYKNLRVWRQFGKRPIQKVKAIYTTLVIAHKNDGKKIKSSNHER